MNKRHYEHTLPNIRGSLSNTYFVIIEADFFPRRLMLHGDIVKSHGKGVRSFYDHQVLILQLTEGHEYREGVSHPVHLHVEHKTVHAVVRTP